MKSITNLEIANNICNQLVKFNNAVYGSNRGVDEKMSEAFYKVYAVVRAADKHDLDDFDLWVFVTYREGRLLSKNKKIRKKEPVSLIDAICDGFDLPSSTTFVKIQIKPVFKKEYNVRVADESVFEIHFGVGEEQDLTNKQLRRRYGLGPEENLFSRYDLESESIFRFYNPQEKDNNHTFGV